MRWRNDLVSQEFATSLPISTTLRVRCAALLSPYLSLVAFGEVYQFDAMVDECIRSSVLRIGNHDGLWKSLTDYHSMASARSGPFRCSLQEP